MRRCSQPCSPIHSPESTRRAAAVGARRIGVSSSPWRHKTWEQEHASEVEFLRVRLEPHSNFLFKSWQRDIDQRQSTATIAAIKMLVPTCSKLSASTQPRPQGTARLTSQIAPCPCTLLAERRSHMQTAPASRAVRLKARGSRGTCSKRNRS